ncbi:PLDc N-terminal domain-containing protein [Sphingobacterium mizutaii]|uniref:PLDc N-terminal domain-containing protein n=2 Tax=Sphingobacterium mizutaii TaxID=1010 RepID=UPI001626F89E
MNLLFLGSLLASAIWIIMLFITVFSIYHIVTNRDLSSVQRVVWILVVLVFNVIGSIIYLALNNSKKVA